MLRKSIDRSGDATVYLIYLASSQLSERWNSRITSPLWGYSYADPDIRGCRFRQFYSSINYACQIVSGVEGTGIDIHHFCQKLPYSPKQWMRLIGVA